MGSEDNWDQPDCLRQLYAVHVRHLEIQNANSKWLLPAAAARSCVSASAADAVSAGIAPRNGGGHPGSRGSRRYHPPPESVVEQGMFRVRITGGCRLSLKDGGKPKVVGPWPTWLSTPICPLHEGYQFFHDRQSEACATEAAGRCPIGPRKGAEDALMARRGCRRPNPSRQTAG